MNETKMSVLQLTMITAVNMIGAGIIMLPAELAKVGSISIFAWIISTIGAVALAYAFAKCSMYSKKSGGLGGYAEYTFGKAGGFLTNFTYSFSILISDVAISLSVVGYAAEFLHIQLTPLMMACATIAILWLADLGSLGGAKLTGIIAGNAVWGILIPIASLLLIGRFYFSFPLYVENWNVNDLSTGSAITQSIAVTIWGLLGMESACANVDAVENPEKNVPLAVLGGTTLAAIIYILSTNLIFGIVPNAELAASTAPFGLVFTKMLNPMIGQIVNAMFIIACLGSLIGWQFTMGNVNKDSAINGYFPKLLGETNTKDVPVKGIIAVTIIQTLLGLMTMSPKLSEQFMLLLNLTVVTNLVPFFLALASLPTIPTIMEQANRNYAETRTANMIGFIASIYCFYACYSSGLEAMTYGSLLTSFGWTLYGFTNKSTN